MAKCRISRIGRIGHILGLNGARAISPHYCAGVALWAFFALGALAARAEDPFTAAPRRFARDGAEFVEIRFAVPPGHYLYADELSVTAENAELTLEAAPAPVEKEDPFTGDLTRVYAENFSTLYRLASEAPPALAMTVRWMGCDETRCYLPQVRRFELTLDAAPDAARPSVPIPTPALPPSSPADARPEWERLIERFEERGRIAGYVGVPEFMAFLNRADSPVAASPAPRRRLSAVLLLMIVGGIALNLTPCVLPMIPVNLAIIGAGMKAGSRRRGWLLGGAYGLAMALAYGALGLVVVLTGAQFGTLNASPWFNAAIAALFVALALGMFGVFNIDLTRFQPTGRGAGRGGVALAFGMGAVSALLAGACVAPVVISVILLASDLYLGGNPWGLALPFLLGVGMGLPWPFAGAGLALLPKPGGWMNYVKYAFGLLILGFAVYYASLAVSAFRGRSALPLAAAPANGAAVSAVEQDAEGAALAAALRRALAERKPAVVDFWATWCKNCHAMDRTTLKDPAVQEKMAGMIFAKYQAEQPGRAPAKAVLDRFLVIGLPTYILLAPIE